MSSVFVFLPGQVIALIIGVYYYKYLPRSYKLVFCLIAIASFCESYGYYLSHFLHESNAWVFNLYMIIEVWLLGTAAIYLINNHKIRKLFIALLIFNSILWASVIIRNSIYLFANISMVFGCCLITVMYIIVLYHNSLFNDKGTLKESVFWLAIATILYFGCDIPYMGLHNYLVLNYPSLGTKLSIINTLLDIIRYPIVAISFILLGRQKKVALKAA